MIKTFTLTIKGPFQNIFGFVASIIQDHTAQNVQSDL